MKLWILMVMMNRAHRGVSTGLQIWTFEDVQVASTSNNVASMYRILPAGNRAQGSYKKNILEQVLPHPLLKQCAFVYIDFSLA